MTTLDDISLTGTIDQLTTSMKAKTDPAERAALARAIAILCEGEAHVQMIRSGQAVPDWPAWTCSPERPRQPRTLSEVPAGFYRKHILAAIDTLPPRFTRRELRDVLKTREGWTEGRSSINNALNAELKAGRLARVATGAFEKIPAA